MGENESHSVATAIRDSDSEGFVAGTLFSQGWNVQYRALDIPSLLAHLDSSAVAISLILISTDVDGLTPDQLTEFTRRGVKFFLFAADSSGYELYPEAIAQPTTPLELLALIRGSLRTPMIRSSRREKIRARTIAISSLSASPGCTTLAINIGAELAQRDHKVLIVDAHALFPAFAIRLGERGLNASAELRNISQQLWALEVTQAEISTALAALERARFEFDFIIIDSGLIRDFPAILTGRRWCSEIFNWIATCADELWVMSKSDELSCERLKTFTSEISQNSIKPELTFVQCLGSSAKRAKSESEFFLQAITPVRPQRMLQYPWDPRSVLSAEDQHSTLLDTHERGILRKAIAHIAGELKT